jgi:5-methylcytosine-specific restriction endonuclease McrA
MTHPHWSVTKGKRWRLVVRGGYKCFYCKGALAAREGCSNSATRDHVVPRSRGGGGGENVVVACWRCNQVKGDMTAEEFRAMYPTPDRLPVLPHPKEPRHGCGKKGREARVRPGVPAREGG